MPSSDLNKREQKTPGVGEKQNTPHSKTAIIIGLLVVGAMMAAAFLSPDGGGKKGDEKEKEIQVSEGNSKLKASDPIKLALTNPTLAETLAPTPPPVINLPEPPKPPETIIRDVPGVQQQGDQQQKTRVRRRTKVTKNQALANWLQLQAQTFQAPPSLEMKEDGRKSVAENSSDELDQKMEELLKNGQALIDSYAGGGVQKSQQQQFFENAGKEKDNMILKATRQNKVAPYTLPAGTMIPCELITGINTDLPGNITAAVTEHVYDFVDPQVILIPQGSKLFGTYNSKVDFAQKRVQFVWKRLTYPDGSTLDLNGMPATDPQGFSGVRDQTNMHYGPMITAAILTAGFGVLPDLIDNKNNNNNSGSYNNNNDRYETAKSKVAESIGRMGESLFSKQLNRQPTLVLRPGKKFMIQANVDIPFTRVWREKARRW